jgi:DNA modification methylase
MTLINNDCLDAMPSLAPGIVDMVLCDIPFGVTRNVWDKPIPLIPLWSQYRRMVKKNAAIILFGVQPYSSTLVTSNPKWFRYSWVWRKTTSTGFLNAKKMPLRQHEDILVFYRALPVYNPQKTNGHPRKVSTAAHKRNCVRTTNYGEHGLTTYDSTERYPTSVLSFPTDKQKSSEHPTQKPLALMEYLIRTYTNEGALVLDNCMGSGVVGRACKNTGRDFIGIEKSPSIFANAERLLSV